MNTAPPTVPESKFEAGERILKSKIAELGKAQAALRVDSTFINKRYAAKSARKNDGALYPLVADKNIAALAENERGNAVFSTELNESRRLLRRLRHEEQLGGSAYFKGGIIFHRDSPLSRAAE